MPMFGLFGFLNIGLTTIYPILASYCAYTRYSEIATKSGASTINVAGLTIPVGTVLKRATRNPQNALEEDTLNFHLLNLQMWFVYWIVSACVMVVEELTFVMSLPLYSIVRLFVSAWLILPIVKFSSLTKLNKVLTFQDVQTEWVLFSSDGCGLVYFKYLVPIFEKKTASLTRLWDKLMLRINTQAVKQLVRDEASSSTSSSPPKRREDKQKPPADTLLHSWAGIVGTMFLALWDQAYQEAKASYLASSHTSLLNDKDFSEYALVDKPDQKDSQVKQRVSSSTNVGPNETHVSSSRRFRIW